MSLEPNYETKSFDLTIKGVDVKQGIVEGYASVFDFKDSDGDVITPGAFAKSIQEQFPRNRIKVYLDHNPRAIVGKALEIKEDSYGLFTRTKLSAADPGPSTLTKIDEGIISDMSVGFRIVKQDDPYARRDRKISEVRLFEYSFVGQGANELAQITGVKGTYTELFEQAEYLMKQGRVLSEKNRRAVEEAITSLQALLAAAEPTQVTPPEEAAVKSAEPEELHSLLAAVRVVHQQMRAA